MLSFITRIVQRFSPATAASAPFEQMGFYRQFEPHITEKAEKLIELVATGTVKSAHHYYGEDSGDTYHSIDGEEPFYKFRSPRPLLKPDPGMHEKGTMPPEVAEIWYHPQFRDILHQACFLVAANKDARFFLPSYSVVRHQGSHFFTFTLTQNPYSPG